MLPREFEFPVAHAEGRFVTETPEEAELYKVQGLAPLIYAENLNGSAAQIAGMQDSSGRVLGLMPHPERFMYRENHYDPDWNGDEEWGWGWFFFRSIYEEIASKEAIPAGA
jgi:phosphoribosylformylglycinamidine synthase